jgi:hypothetical protein
VGRVILGLAHLDVEAIRAGSSRSAAQRAVRRERQRRRQRTRVEVERLPAGPTAAAFSLDEPQRVRRSDLSRRAGVRVLARDVQARLVRDSAAESSSCDRQGGDKDRDECESPDPDLFCRRPAHPSSPRPAARTLSDYWTSG